MQLPGRWRILAALFCVRAAMGFQFGSVAAISPLVARDFGVGLADIGLLIGLYLMPGVLLALPGGAIGHRFGDKRTVLFGLMLMVAGGVVMAMLPSWEAQIAGRVLAGIGGVLLNVLMSKMVTDWFGGREIATAMAIFVNSWPAGIALALVALPMLGEAFGVASAFLATSLVLVIGFALLAQVYRAPAMPASASEVASVALGGVGRWAVVLAGLAWSLYNIGFAMIFSFGPSLLAERGWTVPAAGSTASIVLWLALLSVPLGGLLADRSGRPGLIAAFGCLASAVLLLVESRLEPIHLFVGLGIVGGLPAGALMSLPARVLGPGTRAIGMGIFYTVFYTGMAVGPFLGGWMAATAGTAAAAFYFGAVALIGCLVAVWRFERRLARAVAANLV